MDYSELLDNLPDVRDGLNRKERAILVCLKEAQEEFGGRNVPTITLYGRVVEKIDIGPEEFQAILSRLVGGTRNTDGSMSFG
jgi:hypothetical protein